MPPKSLQNFVVSHIQGHDEDFRRLLSSSTPTSLMPLKTAAASLLKFRAEIAKVVHRPLSAMVMPVGLVARDADGNRIDKKGPWELFWFSEHWRHTYVFASELNIVARASFVFGSVCPIAAEWAPPTWLARLESSRYESPEEIKCLREIREFARTQADDFELMQPSIMDSLIFKLKPIDPLGCDCPLMIREGYENDPSAIDIAPLLRNLILHKEFGMDLNGPPVVTLKKCLDIILECGPLSWQDDLRREVKVASVLGTLLCSTKGLMLLLGGIPCSLRLSLCRSLPLSECKNCHMMIDDEESEESDLEEDDTCSECECQGCKSIIEKPSRSTVNVMHPPCVWMSIEGHKRLHMYSDLVEVCTLLTPIRNTPLSRACAKYEGCEIADLTWVDLREYALDMKLRKEEESTSRERRASKINLPKEPPLPHPRPVEARCDDKDAEAAVQAANELAREARAQRRAGGKLGGSILRPAPIASTESGPSEASQKPRSPAKAPASKLSPKAKRKAQESKEAFLKAAAPAFVAARCQDEAVYEDPLPSIERTLSRALRASASRTKRSRKAAAYHDARLRAQTLLV